MVNVAELAAARQELLGPTADRRAKETGCVQRERTFTGSGLVQALVFAAKQSIAGSPRKRQRFCMRCCAKP